MNSQISRRDAMKMAAGGATAFAWASISKAQEANAKTIRMGFIGVGARGTVLLNEVLRYAEVEVPAVCDIDEKNLNRALDLVEKSRNKRPEGFSKGPEDYRRLLSRDDINA